MRFNLISVNRTSLSRTRLSRMKPADDFPASIAVTGHAQGVRRRR